MKLGIFAGKHGTASTWTAPDGTLWFGDNLRAQFLADAPPAVEKEKLLWSWTLAPGQSKTITFKIPSVVLTEKSEHAALAKLDFDTEHRLPSSVFASDSKVSFTLLTSFFWP